MARRHKKSSYHKKLGQAPGSLTYIGPERDWKPSIELIQFNSTSYTDTMYDKSVDMFPHLKEDHVNWINIFGVHNTKLIENLGTQFKLHPLIMEDILSTEQRPKIEEFEDYLFFTLQMLTFDDESESINTEQISFILGSNYVVSLQEEVGDVFDPIRNRVKNNIGRVRTSKSDYLAYILLDAVVDHYYIIDDKISQIIERMELQIIEREGDNQVVTKVVNLKKDALLLRRSIVPLRESIGNLKKGTSRLIEPETLKFLNDLYDHISIQGDSADQMREGLNNLIELNHSFQGARLNEVMKTLTIISTIFIPLGFLAGLYGMNFNYMPELHYKYGYYILLGVMACIVIAMFIHFKRKNWF